MNAKNSPDEISYRILDEFVKESTVTQRALADRLGIALGLVNAYIKRLYKKGYIKIKTLPRNKIKYIITPKGLAEKTKLTYKYMLYSITYFNRVRLKIETTYAVMAERRIRTVLLWGDGELAELCYISTRGFPIAIAGVVGNKRAEHAFFGKDVYTARDIGSIHYDAVLVCTLDEQHIHTIQDTGIDAKNVYYLD